MYLQSSYILLSNYRISAHSHIEAAIVRFDRALWKAGKHTELPAPPFFESNHILLQEGPRYDGKTCWYYFNI